MESLFSQLLPDVNLDEALSPGSKEATLPASGASGPSPTFTQNQAQSTPQAAESISEAVPHEADGFDWQEDVNDLADGMAALSVEPTGTGYLGTLI